MFNMNTALPVRAVDQRRNTLDTTRRPTKSDGRPVAEAGKLPEQSTKVDNANVHGALTKFRESMREFAFGVMRPAVGLVGEEVYETSFSQAMENLRRDHNGALTGMHNGLTGFTFGILRPETGMIGEDTFDSSHSLTMANLSKKHIGAAAGITEAIHGYMKAATEHTGPMAAMVEPAAATKASAEALASQIPDSTASGIPATVSLPDMLAADTPDAVGSMKHVDMMV